MAMERIYVTEPRMILRAGHQGESLARCICFPLTDLVEQYGAGTWTIVFRRPFESDPYVVANQEEVGEYAVWGLDATDTAVCGEGRVELRYYVDDVLCKTDVYAVSLLPSLGTTGDAPSPYEDIIDTVAGYAAEARDAADEAGSAVSDAVTELQAELDEAISGATVDSEVINARVDADGTTYGTLKQRLDAENTALKNHLTEEQNLRISNDFLSVSGKNIIPSVFKNGTWAGTTFSDATVYNYRVAMPNYIEFDRAVTLTAENGYTMRIMDFNSDGTWHSMPADNAQTYTIPANTKFAITVKNTANETTKAKADVAIYASAVTFEDYAKYRDDEADANISEITKDMEQVTAKLARVASRNLLDESTLSVGYVQSDGSYHTDVTTYKYMELLPVTPGDVYSFWVQSGSAISAANARFTCAYDSARNAVSASGSNSNITSYTVPNGISYVRFSFPTSVLALDGLMVIKDSAKPLTYEEYFTPYYETSDAFGFGARNVYRKRQADLSTAITFPSTNVVKNVVYAFTAAIASMGAITIGQGESADYFMSSVTIDDTNVTITVNGSEYSQAHNLTVANYINVKIMVNDNTKATVMVESNGDVYTRTLGWYGDSTKDYYCKQTGAVLSDVSFSVTFTDSGCDTYIFGDSYVAVLESTSKWSHYLIADGFGDNVLINALPGENGADAYNALINLLELGRPKRIIWCMGMNDGSDTDDTPNTDWMNRIQSFLSVCANKGITPILATVPTVPSINHEAKNAWVRNSGYRYIDFAKAVGASSSGVWYTGMLSSDNVHPTELGAKRLYSQVLCDAQEVTLR